MSSSLYEQLARSEAGKWATFYLAGELFALPVEDVQEVLMPQPLTPVPLAPEHIVGLLNLRGQIMTAIDLRRRLHFPERGEESARSLLVIKAHDRLISVVVDEIGDVLDLPEERWQPPPETLGAQHRSFVFGMCPIEQQMVLGLQVESISGDEDRPHRGGLAG
ncbi:MAG: chemotaxis protein CheW [Deltaproteobacteria bacterium]|nr:chemotaxis protein CheW [Deltaproteobacteria bacterium]